MKKIFGLWLCILSVPVYAQESEIIVRALYRTKTSGAFGSVGDIAELYIDGNYFTKQFGPYGQEDQKSVSNGPRVIEIRIHRDGDGSGRYRDRRQIRVDAHYNIVTVVYGVDGSGKITGLRVDSDVSKRQGALLETSMENSIREMARELESKISRGARIAIVNISSSGRNQSELAADNVEITLINDNYYVVDRYQLDMLREEQNLQMSGEVDDDTAVSIGKLAGASVIITGSVAWTEGSLRLRLRALDVQTGRVLGLALRRL